MKRLSCIFKALSSLRTLAFFSLLLWNYPLRADEKVVLIKTVTTTGKSFALQLGHHDGIQEDQQSLFSTKDASIVALCTAVSRYYSVWRIKNEAGTLPFKKGDSVIYSRSIRGIWDYLSKRQAEIYVKNQKKERRQPRQAWIFRSHYSYALSQSTTQVLPQRYTARNGFQTSLLINQKLNPRLEYAFGLRIDREKSRLQKPALLVPTLRTLLLLEASYSFDPPYSKETLYLSLGLGYGYSRTSVNELRATGMALILPLLRMGKLIRLSPHYSLVMEGTIESIASDENFKGRDPQLTHIINTKLGVGFTILKRSIDQQSPLKLLCFPLPCANESNGHCYLF